MQPHAYFYEAYIHAGIEGALRHCKHLSSPGGLSRWGRQEGVCDRRDWENGALQPVVHQGSETDIRQLFLHRFGHYPHP